MENGRGKFTCLKSFYKDVIKEEGKWSDPASEFN